MTVYEADIPGVGRKFELELDGNERLIAIVHHSGKRELYRRPSPDEDSTKLAELTDKQARQLGSILEGAYFQPVETDSLDVPIGESIIEWVSVEAGSSVTGETIGDCDIRQRTGASVVAVQRGNETLANPEPTFRFEPDDLIVAIGTRDQHATLERLAGADSSGE